jgi:hypothetical protein
MLGRIAAAAALIALAGCAGMESAGRESRSTEPSGVASAPPPAATPAPAPAQYAAAPPSASAPTPSATAPPAESAEFAAPAQAERPVATASRSGDDVVVSGERERQVRPPAGDPRSNAERMQDIRAWDQCVTRVQSAFERDPMRPQLQSPEEYCSESLGMAERRAVPVSRLEER